MKKTPNAPRNAAIVQEYLSTDATIRAIAAKFGISRGAVIGVIDRSGVARRVSGYKSSPKTPRAAPPRAAAKKASSPESGVTEFLAPFPSPPTIPAEQREWRRLAFDRMVASRGCKFPLGDLAAADFAYCCAPRGAHSPYYADHHALTHRGFVHAATSE